MSSAICEKAWQETCVSRVTQASTSSAVHQVHVQSLEAMQDSVKGEEESLQKALQVSSLQCTGNEESVWQNSSPQIISKDLLELLWRKTCLLKGMRSRSKGNEDIQVEQSAIKKMCGSVEIKLNLLDCYPAGSQREAGTLGKEDCWSSVQAQHCHWRKRSAGTAAKWCWAEIEGTSQNSLTSEAIIDTLVCNMRRTYADSLRSMDINN